MTRVPMHHAGTHTHSVWRRGLSFVQETTVAHKFVCIFINDELIRQLFDFELRLYVVFDPGRVGANTNCQMTPDDYKGCQNSRSTTIKSKGFGSNIWTPL